MVIFNLVLFSHFVCTTPTYIYIMFFTLVTSPWDTMQINEVYTFALNEKSNILNASSVF